MRRWVGFLVLAIGVAIALPAAAVEWKELAKANTVTITTTDADGSPRHTTVWMVVVDGLPYVRTSPDHGTAFSIAGKGEADPSGMEAALKCAVDLVRRGK